HCVCNIIDRLIFFVCYRYISYWCLFFFFFFFSSRRRHTRWPRDWSSDVCSSDLLRKEPVSILPTRISCPTFIGDSEVYCNRSRSEEGRAGNAGREDTYWFLPQARRPASGHLGGD